MGKKKKTGWFRRGMAREDELERKIEEEIRNEVLRRDQKLKKQRRKLAEEKINLEALEEISGLPGEEIEKIAEEVRSRYEKPRPTKGRKRSSRREWVEDKLNKGPFIVRLLAGIWYLLGLACLPLFVFAFDVEEILEIAWNVRSRFGRSKKRLPILSTSETKGSWLDIPAVRVIRTIWTATLLIAIIFGVVILGRWIVKESSEFARNRINQLQVAKQVERDTPLMEAVGNGLTKTVELLVQEGANVNAKDITGRTALFLAIEEGHKDIAEFLIDKGADVNAKNPRYRYNNRIIDPLTLATERGYANLVELMIGKGADVKMMGAALFPAIEDGNFEIVKILVDNGADLEVKDGDGITPLIRAIKKGEGKLDIAEYLVDKGADVNARSERGLSPLVAVIDDIPYARPREWKQECIDFAKFLVERGAEINTVDERVNIDMILRSGYFYRRDTLVSGLDETLFYILTNEDAYVDERDDYGTTALMRAAAGGQADVVEILVDMGADVKAKSDEGKTAMTYAKEYGYAEIAKLLRKAGAKEPLTEENFLASVKANDIDAVKLLLAEGIDISECGTTAFMIAAEHGYTDIVRTLGNKGVDVNAKDKYGRPLLMLAMSEKGKPEIVKFLVDNGADLDIGGTTSPLTWAVERGYTDVVKSILAREDRGRMVESSYSNALNAAERRGYTAIVKLFLDDGVEIDSDLGFGETLLMHAARDGYTDMVKLLIDRGADVNARSRGGYTALKYAVDRGHKEIVKLLKEAGARE